LVLPQRGREEDGATLKLGSTGPRIMGFLLTLFGRYSYMGSTGPSINVQDFCGVSAPGLAYSLLISSQSPRGTKVQQQQNLAALIFVQENYTPYIKERREYY
jgi:hypothetical protein